MDNSLVYAFEGYVDAMFKDIAPTYGSARDWERDKARSLHELRVRGMRFLTIDLPALRKHFDKCLEEGLYTPSNLFLSAQVSKRVLVPAFGRDLYLQIFDMQGVLRSEPSVYAIADLRQLYEGVGKLFLLCKQEAIDEEVDNFLKIEAELREANLSWHSDNLFEAQNVRTIHFNDGNAIADNGGFANLCPEPALKLSKGDADTLQRVCDIVSSSFGDLHLERDDELVSERPKHGTGRVSNLRKDHSKYDFTKWPAKLDRIFAYDWYATSDLGLGSYQDGLATRYLMNHEDPSKLIAVPKTMSGPRLIGSEPNYHLWIQQLVRAQIEARVSHTPLRHCISFGDQTKNRKMARSSSVVGYLATVDLKNASDRLSAWTVERVFRANITILERIHASRTRTMRGILREVPFHIKLRKCFTQGSACTFPVQTLVYSMIAISSVIITNGERVNRKSVTRAAEQVRVFGDDIIIPTSALPKLTEILQFLQLKVNMTKTFHKGKFRESCGMDAYLGVDVTPARVRAFSVKPSHEVLASMIEGSNNFFKRGLWHVAAWLQSHCQSVELPMVPYEDNEIQVRNSKTLRVSGGYTSFCGYSIGHLRTRWNPNLHRQEVRYHSLVSNSKKVPTQSAHDITEYLFSNGPKNHHPLDFLNPRDGGLGVVDKNSSVMKRGWKPIALPSALSYHGHSPL
jgi:hypothetical protein